MTWQDATTGVAVVLAGAWLALYAVGLFRRQPEDREDR